jgi:hypothetical protein
MKHNIAADGPRRLAQGRYDRDIAAGHAKYSGDSKTASWFKRIGLYFLIRHHATKPNPKDHQPSAGTLW